MTLDVHYKPDDGVILYRKMECTPRRRTPRPYLRNWKTFRLKTLNSEDKDISYC